MTETKELKPLKVNVTKLRTLPSYAMMRNVHLTTIHRWVKNKEVKSIKIDGVTFVLNKDSKAYKLKTQTKNNSNGNKDNRKPKQPAKPVS